MRKLVVLMLLSVALAVGQIKLDDPAKQVFGELEPVNGGTGLDLSAATGVIRSAAGTFSADAGVQHLVASSSANLAGVINDEAGSGLVLFVTASSTTVGETLRVTGSDTYDWGALDLADSDAITGLMPDVNIPDLDTLSEGFTAGSVIFSDGTNLSENNDDLFWSTTDDGLKLGGNVASTADPRLYIQHGLTGTRQDISAATKTGLLMQAWGTGGDGTPTGKVYQGIGLIGVYDGADTGSGGNSASIANQYVWDHGGTGEGGGVIGTTHCDEGGDCFGAHFVTHDQDSTNTGTTQTDLYGVVSTVDRHNGAGKQAISFLSEQLGTRDADAGYGFWGGTFDYGIDFENTVNGLTINTAAMRIPNASEIVARNNADSGNVSMFSVNASDQLTIPTTTVFTASTIFHNASASAWEVGNLAADSTWGLDAHTEATVKDYDFRLIFSGGTASVGEGTATATGGSWVFDTASLEIPNGTGPTTDADGEFAFDTDAWAASRGALQIFDGTANTYAVAALTSDTPTNGQVPKWNTGGTITWENDADSGGAPSFDAVTAGSNANALAMASGGTFLIEKGGIGESNRVIAWALKGSVGTINSGEVVYISGYNLGQNVVEVELADADDSGAMPAIGIALEAITNGATGRVAVGGRLESQDTSSFTAGDELYVDTTAGGLTNTKPTGATAAIQKVGLVLRSNVSTGVITVVGAGRSNDVPNLASTNFWVGNGSGVATAVAMSGDATMDNAGAVTVNASSTTVAGKIEIATPTEINTGTDNTRGISPDGLAGSKYGEVVVAIPLTAVDGDISTGDGKFYFPVNQKIDGWNLVRVEATVAVVGTTGTLNISLTRCDVVATGSPCTGTTAVMLSTALTVDTNESKSATAATPAVIDTANDDVDEDEVIRVDVDGVHTTPSKGTILEMVFQAP